MLKVLNEDGFNAAIRGNHKVICLVHSTWSASSWASKQIFEQLQPNLPGYTLYLINNGSDKESFIYEWLLQQPLIIDLHNNTSKYKNRISGKGEMIGFVEGQIKFFIGAPCMFEEPVLREKIINAMM